MKIMFNTLLTLIVIFWGGNDHLWAQDCNLGNVSYCYSNNENTIITYCPDDPVTENIVVKINDFSFQNGADGIILYDGTGTGGTQLGQISGSGNSGFSYIATPQSEGGNGCVTLNIVSNGTGSCNTGQFGPTDWDVFCQVQCTSPIANMIANITEFCSTEADNQASGVDILFDASGSTHGNGTSFTSYAWDFGDGTTQTTITPTVSHTYATAGGYTPYVVITDDLGCNSSNLADEYIQVSGAPTLNVASDAPAGGVCVGTDFNLAGSEIPFSWMEPIQQPNAPPTVLPDGTGATFASSVFSTQFGDTDVIQDGTNLSITVNMEHSYMGDLLMELVCPDGGRITLLSFPNSMANTNTGGGTTAGNPPGAGQEYTFSMSAATLFNTNTYSADLNLPTNAYRPDGNFATLNGCLMNGEWRIEITDNFNQDDGTLYSWSIIFGTLDENKRTLESFANTYTGVWSGNGVSGTTATPTNSGTQTYTYTVTDNFGCDYAETVDITVLSSSHPSCNIAPTITSSNTVSVNENTTAVVIDVESTDDNNSEGNGLTYSLTNNGPDNPLFTVDSDDGEIRFIMPPDFENPMDNDFNNDYVVEVQVCDSSGECSIQQITISVTEVVEAVLDLNLTVTPNVCPNGVAAYFLTIENNSGENDAVGITISDVLPTDFSFYSDTIEVLNGATQTAALPQPVFGDVGNINWGTFDIPDGASVTIAYNALIDAAATDGVYANNLTGTVATFNPTSVSENITVGGAICTNPTPFICEPAFFQVYKKRGESSKFAQLNPADGSYIEIATVSSSVNAMGLDINSGFVYGAVKKRFVRMDGNGTVLDMGITFPANCYSGDVDENGFWYGKVGADMIKIDLNGVFPVVVATYVGQSLPGADMSYNVDGNFYAAAGQTIYKFDTTTNTKSIVGTVTGTTLPGGAYGAQWTGSDGRLYVSSNTTGEIFRISINNLNAHLIMQTTPGLNSNDGFSCPTELPLPFGYEYGDKIGVGQARNLAYTEDFANDNIPDFDAVWLGVKVDADATDPSNASATGDTNDDGFLPSNNTLPGFTADFDIQLNTNMTNAIIHYGLYLDWDENGTFEDFYGGSTTISGTTTVTITVNVPASFAGGNPVARIRAGQEPLTIANAIGDLDIGETEDFLFSPNVPPTITSSMISSFQENGMTAVLNVQSTDFEGETEGTGLVYSLVGGEDLSIFSIDADDGELHFIVLPNFENPSDDDQDNDYIVEAQVCDSEGACSTQIITITVTDEDEDGDGFTATNGETDDSNPCVPDNTVGNCCEAVSPNISKD